MSELQKTPAWEEQGYMWGCVRRTHPHIYPSLFGNHLFAVDS